MEVYGKTATCLGLIIVNVSDVLQKLTTFYLPVNGSPFVILNTLN